MRLWVCAAFAAALLLASSQAARAEEFTVAPNMEFAWLGAAEPGNFSLWEAKDLKGVNAARLGARFLSFGVHERWSPSYKLALTRDDYQLDISVGGLEGKPLHVVLEVWRGKDQQISRQDFDVAPGPNALLGLQLDWTEDGSVTASVAVSPTRTEVRRAKLPGAPQTLSIAVSTGSVDFQPIQLGRNTR